jgi:hypothetical protein
MRRFLIAAVMAGGLIALWAAILPLTAQPAPKPDHSPALSKALFLCHGPHGIDQTCATALARALVLEPPDTGTTTTRVSNQFCRANPQLFASVDRLD